MEYCAIKAHFERPKYDYFRYNGRIRSGDYEKRKDKNWFFRLSRAFNTTQLHEYYIANFVAGNTWVGKMNKDTWLEWKRKIVRLQEVYNDDLDAILQLTEERGISPKDVFRCESGQHPIIFRLLLGGYIQLETFTILHLLTLMASRFDKKLEDDPVWEEWSVKVKKYAPFLRLYLTDKNWYMKVTKEKLLNTLDTKYSNVLSCPTTTEGNDG